MRTVPRRKMNRPRATAPLMICRNAARRQRRRKLNAKPAMLLPIRCPFRLSYRLSNSHWRSHKPRSSSDIPTAHPNRRRPSAARTRNRPRGKAPRLLQHLRHRERTLHRRRPKPRHLTTQRSQQALFSKNIKGSRLVQRKLTRPVEARPQRKRLEPRRRASQASLTRIGPQPRNEALMRKGEGRKGARDAISALFRQRAVKQAMAQDQLQSTASVRPACNSRTTRCARGSLGSLYTLNTGRRSCASRWMAGLRCEKEEKQCSAQSAARSSRHHHESAGPRRPTDGCKPQAGGFRHSCRGALNAWTMRPVTGCSSSRDLTRRRAMHLIGSLRPDQFHGRDRPLYSECLSPLCQIKAASGSSPSARRAGFRRDGSRRHARG